MKRLNSTRSDPIENRRDWLYFSGLAQMRVWNSGGPIHAPHERVLQLLIRPHEGNHESWTVYRHQSDARKDGKLVFKLWDREADRRRVLSLGRARIPKEWHKAGAVTEREFPLAARWVSVLERGVGALSVPPIAGPVQQLGRGAENTLSFWRERQESEFSWHPPPPRAWRPLASLFSSLLHAFRQYAGGQPLPAVNQLGFYARDAASLCG